MSKEPRVVSAEAKEEPASGAQLMAEPGNKPAPEASEIDWADVSIEGMFD